jgi:pimeloyl-ACP methyl ester carboxylesterase
MSFRPTFTRRRVIATGAAAAASAAILTPSSATAATGSLPAPGAKPTIVLVHGGYADSSCWNGVVRELQSKGYTTISGSNPLRGIPTDAPYIGSLLDSISGPVVLVAHSMGGTVITNAAAGKGNVKALVYIAAFVPDVGETQGELIDKFPGSEVLPVSVPVPYTKPDGTTGTDLYLSKDGPSMRTPSPTRLRPPRGGRSRRGGWLPARTRRSRPRPNAGCTAVRTSARSSKCRPRPTLR